MGQEITSSHFSAADFERFGEHLRGETAALADLLNTGRCSEHRPVGGFEIEAWLLDEALRPAPRNREFLEILDDPLASAELALFNFELNNQPRALQGGVFRAFESELEDTWMRTREAARRLGLHALQIGILPTLREGDLTLKNISNLNRYHALNQQVLASRAGRPLRLDIVGHQHLCSEHGDVMLEAATTSFQIHLQTPASLAHHYYNASIIASAATVAVSANAPYLFALDLWEETRIPLFEEAVEVGGFDGVAHGPLRRVGFGSDYARQSIMECFTENLEHFPILLPMAFEETAELPHLRLHNGTIWRWNRPLLGFDADATPHIRIEHRVVPAGPTVLDAIANAAFYYGLTQDLAPHAATPALPFAQARDNFYQAARHGLGAVITWDDGDKIPLRNLLQQTLIPRARAGLQALKIDADDADHYLGIIEQRVRSGQTGSAWQRRFVAEHGTDMTAMTAAYRDRQILGRPVHEWDI